MHIKNARFVISCLVLVLASVISACNSMLFEEREITSGEFSGIRIGDSKDDVLKSIRRMPVTEIGAVPSHPFYASAGYTDALGNISATDEIVVRSSAAGGSTFRFVNGISEFHLKPTKRLTPEISQLEHLPLQEFRVKLATFLNSDRTASANPVLGDDLPKKVDIYGEESRLREFIQGRDGWLIVNPLEKPQGARLTSYFERGQLRRIEYFRSRTSLDLP